MARTRPEEFKRTYTRTNVNEPISEEAQEALEELNNFNQNIFRFWSGFAIIVISFFIISMLIEGDFGKFLWILSIPIAFSKARVRLWRNRRIILKRMISKTKETSKVEGFSRFIFAMILISYTAFLITVIIDKISTEKNIYPDKIELVVKTPNSIPVNVNATHTSQ